MRSLLMALDSSFRNPTSKQKEGYARYVQTLSAAAVIGAVTLAFAASESTTSVVSRVVAMALMGVVLFLLAAVLSRGE